MLPQERRATKAWAPQGSTRATEQKPLTPLTAWAQEQCQQGWAAHKADVDISDSDHIGLHPASPAG